MTELDLDMLELQGFESDSNHIDKYIQGFESLIQKQKQYGRILEMTGVESYTVTVNKLNDLTQTPMHGMEGFVSDNLKKIKDMIASFVKRIWNFFFGKDGKDNLSIKDDKQVAKEELKNLKDEIKQPVDKAINSDKNGVSFSKMKSLKDRFKTTEVAEAELLKEEAKVKNTVVNNPRDDERLWEARANCIMLEAIAKTKELKALTEDEEQRLLDDAATRAEKIVLESALFASFKNAVKDKVGKVATWANDHQGTFVIGEWAHVTATFMDIHNSINRDTFMPLEENLGEMAEEELNKFTKALEEANKRTPESFNISETEYVKKINDSQAALKLLASATGTIKQEYRKLKNVIRKAKSVYEKEKAIIIARRLNAQSE